MACVLYALQNVFLERYLNLHHFMTMALVYWTSLAVAWLVIAFRSPENTDLVFPQGMQWVWLLVVAVTLTGADYFFFRAYASDANATVVSILVVTLPVFVGVFNFLIDRQLPTMRQVIALALVALAVYLVSSGKAPEEAVENVLGASSTS